MPRETDVLDLLVGARLRLRREALGISRDELARLLGVTASRVRDYERGARRIGAERLAVMARALGVATSYFFDISTGTEPSIRVPESLSPVEATELLSAYSSISDTAVRHRIVELIRAISATPPTCPG